MKYSLIINPHGGVKSGYKILEKVKPLFEEADADLNIIETEYAGHARDIATEFQLNDFTGLCAIGGDGTMLNCSRKFGSEGIPILGINLGNLGFLADIDPKDYPTLLACSGNPGFLCRFYQLAATCLLWYLENQ